MIELVLMVKYIIMKVLILLVGIFYVFFKGNVK